MFRLARLLPCFLLDSQRWLPLLIVLFGGVIPSVAAAGNEAKVQIKAEQATVAWPGFSAGLHQKLAQARRAASNQHAGWHTRWLDAAGQPIFTNRLILSDSPYLLEHAHNPVNWYPYGPAAFAAAKAQNKPLFISIGYASCHWCHVMARESFESAAVARELNTSFIAVKVDRQQMPGLDQRYQIAVALVNSGQTGWPASVFALPDGRPFYASLYQPEPQFLRTLKAVAHAWREQRPAVDADAEKLTALLRRVLDQKAKAATLNEALLTKTVQALQSQIDPFQGGFGDGIKFPQATRLAFLLGQLAQAQACNAAKPAVACGLNAAQTQALRQVLDLTLSHMARGGVFDQLGGGFFRYSTTPDWQVPHFEKMANDQAMLAGVYLKAGLVLGRANDERVAERTLDFVIHHMAAPDGGFIAALSADSRVPRATQAPAHHAGHAQEGYFYTWTPAEIKAVLPPDEARLALRYWSISPSGGVDGRSVPHRADPASEMALAHSVGLTLPGLADKMARIRQQLLAARQARPAPDRDDNRILSWNGLLIQALAEGGRLLNQPRFTASAEAAAVFVQNKMRLPDGQLAHSFNRGVASGRANLADHADFAMGLIALYDATRQAHWLDEAKVQWQVVRQNFAAPTGGFYDQPRSNHKTGQKTAADGDVLALPLRPIDDGAEPAGNAQVLALVLALAERTGDEDYRAAADQILASFSGLIARDPTAFTGLLAGLADQRFGPVDNLGYAANGKIRIELLRVAENRAKMHFLYTSPWHSNAYHATAGSIPTTITALPADRIASIDYPPGHVERLAFSTKPLNLYTGTETAAMKLRPQTSGPLRLSVQIQACSDRICLAPQHVPLWLPPWRADH